jgi:tetratricopeptide (TPR) repeat protein
MEEATNADMKKMFTYATFNNSFFKIIKFSGGIKYFEEKKYLKAIEKLTEAIEKERLSYFFCKRSECYAKLSMWIESYEDAKKCIEKDINIIEAYEQAAIALKNLNKVDQAIEVLKRGISVDKNPNPFENKKYLKMFTLLEEFENIASTEKEKKNLKNKIEKNEESIVESKNIENLRLEIKILKDEQTQIKNILMEILMILKK